MPEKYYVTTPIYYVNDIPHIGHTCTTVAADVAARFAKLQNKEVFFLTGTDEHGAKVARAAKESGQEPKEFCDQVAQRFQDIWPKLNINYDYFIRTTNPQHEAIFSELVTKLYKQGDVYKGRYEGLYCVGCEKFITEKELVNGQCPLHHQKPEYQSEENYFFKLTKYVPTLIEAIENPEHPLHYEVQPEAKRNEVLSRLKDEVVDISISRANVSWGIPIPWDKSQTIYVWIEALGNYYTATRITNRERFWNKDTEIDHLVGKEILWFHVAIWPALLMALNLPLPDRIYAHNFYMIDGQKMSKSIGNVIAPGELLERYGADATRYLICSSFPHTNDSDIGWSRFDKKYNSDLANGLGNLVARIAKLCEEIGLEAPEETCESFDSAGGDFEKAIKRYHFDEALTIIWGKIADLNRYFNEQQPWKQEGEALKETLLASVRAVHEIAFLLSPFMPETANSIKQQFSGKVIAQKPLFPKILLK